MTTRSRTDPPRQPRRRIIAWAAALLFTLGLVPPTASAHGPDPALAGGPFGQNQDLRYRWRAGSEPTAALKTAIRDAADDVNATRASKAATFTYDAAGANPIGYGAGATCGVNGIACFTRDVPDGFTMWLREQGHVFDWGSLRWCQAYVDPPNGCYDAETIALDEFGHIEGLGHHVNWADDSDYVDAVVQTYSRTKPGSGWNMHVLGRCDVATLQMQYDMSTSGARYSTCLDLATDLTLAAAPTGIINGSATTLTATLKVVASASSGRLGGNLVSGRSVTLQRRTPGATTWTTVAAMPPGSAMGTYVLSQRPGADTEYRAVFGTPSTEGINGDTSLTVRVYVSTCAASTAKTPTPQAQCL
jgi:hypothetical protein